MINTAVIGRGWIAEKWIDAARAHGDFCLKATYSRSMADAEAFARAQGAELCFDSLEALCACPEVDAVYIASPNRLHAGQSLRLLRAGKHVCVEKPMTLNLEEARALFRAAEENGVVLLEALRSLHVPAMAMLRAALPKLGRLRFARFSYCQYSSKYDAFKAGRRFNTFDPALGNSAFMDLGVYLVEAMVFLFGSPDTVGGQHICLGDWDAAGTVLAGYDGMQAELSYSKISDSHIPSEIQGEKGTLVVDHIANLESARIVYRTGETEELSFPASANNMISEACDFLEMVAGRQSPLSWRDCSLASMAVMDRARAALNIRFPE